MELGKALYSAHLCLACTWMSYLSSSEISELVATSVEFSLVLLYMQMQMVLLAPSRNPLHKMLDLCAEYAGEHNLVFSIPIQYGWMVRKSCPILLKLGLCFRGGRRVL